MEAIYKWHGSSLPPLALNPFNSQPASNNFLSLLCLRAGKSLHSKVDHIFEKKWLFQLEESSDNLNDGGATIDVCGFTVEIKTNFPASADLW